MNKKQLNTRAISNELEGGASLFFAKPAANPLPGEKPDQNIQKKISASKNETKKVEKEVSVNPIPNQHPEELSSTHSVKPEESHHVTTSPLHDVLYRSWKEAIENTETHNSSLRLTNEENYAVEDMVNELKRSLKVKTSLNEVARLGLLYILHDFKQNREKSLVYKVKKS